MKTITIQIDEKYAEVITVSLCGRHLSWLNVSTGSYAIADGDNIVVDEHGEIKQIHADKQ